MHGPSEVLECFESALDERLVDDHLRSDVRQFAPLPGLHLLSHRLEVSLHSIDPDRDAVDERERLRVFCEHRSEVPGKRHVRTDENAMAAGHRQTYALVMRVERELVATVGLCSRARRKHSARCPLFADAKSSDGEGSR